MLLTETDYGDAGEADVGDVAETDFSGTDGDDVGETDVSDVGEPDVGDVPETDFGGTDGDFIGETDVGDVGEPDSAGETDVGGAGETDVGDYRLTARCVHWSSVNGGVCRWYDEPSRISEPHRDEPSAVGHSQATAHPTCTQRNPPCA